MKVIGVKVLDDGAKTYPEAKGQLDTWRKLVKAARWKNPHDLKADFGKADLVGGKRVVFNIKGNDFRLLAKVDYELMTVIAMKFDTHEGYNSWKL